MTEKNKSRLAGTAYLKIQLTDASLAGITDDIEMAILDGVRRALAKIELVADEVQTDTVHDVVVMKEKK